MKINSQLTEKENLTKQFVSDIASLSLAYTVDESKDVTFGDATPLEADTTESIDSSNPDNDIKPNMEVDVTFTGTDSVSRTCTYKYRRLDLGVIATISNIATTNPTIAGYDEESLAAENGYAEDAKPNVAKELGIAKDSIKDHTLNVSEEDELEATAKLKLENVSSSLCKGTVEFNAKTRSDDVGVFVLENDKRIYFKDINQAVPKVNQNSTSKVKKLILPHSTTSVGRVDAIHIPVSDDFKIHGKAVTEVQAYAFSNNRFIAPSHLAAPEGVNIELDEGAFNYVGETATIPATFIVQELPAMREELIGNISKTITIENATEDKFDFNTILTLKVMDVKDGAVLLSNHETAKANYTTDSVTNTHIKFNQEPGNSGLEKDQTAMYLKFDDYLKWGQKWQGMTDEHGFYSGMTTGIKKLGTMEISGWGQYPDFKKTSAFRGAKIPKFYYPGPLEYNYDFANYAEIDYLYIPKMEENFNYDTPTTRRDPQGSIAFAGAKVKNLLVPDETTKNEMIKYTKYAYMDEEVTVESEVDSLVFTYENIIVVGEKTEEEFYTLVNTMIQDSNMGDVTADGFHYNAN